ncbi:MAG: SAF domain-containing protein [Clostridia bacterium]|nr:SAF domain-containing protein [Clostridia bacterium]
MKNRTVIGIICIALALIISFAVLPVVAGLMNRSTVVVRASKKINGGAMITADVLEKVSVGVKNLPEGVIKDTSEVLGKYAVGDMFPGDYVTSAKIKSEADGAADMLSRLEEGNLAVTVAVSSFAGGFSGQLSNGDLVRIMVVNKNGTVSPGALSAVRVITTVTKDAVLRDNSGVRGQEGEDIPVSIMFSVNPEQAALLFGYSAEASVCCAFLCHSGSPSEEKYLAEQKEWFENRSKEENNGGTGSGAQTSGNTQGSGGIISEAGAIIRGELPRIGDE